MAISELNTKIKQSIEAINVGTDAVPSYCGWLPAERSRAGLTLSKVKCSYPALLQYTDGHSETELEFITRHNIDFYLINPKPKQYDVLTIMEIHDLLSGYIYDFLKNLKQYYDCDFAGNRVRLVDQLPDGEAGIYFTLQIDVQRPC